MNIHPDDLERLSNLEPHQLPKNLHPDVRRAVVNRMIEKREGQPRAPKKSVTKPATTGRRKIKVPPTVKRGKTGLIESVRTPIAPVGGESPSKPTPSTPLPTSNRRKTRTGKKLDKVTGKVLAPSVKRGESGKAVGLSQEERRAAVTTVLPEAGSDVMNPAQKATLVHAPGTLRRGGERGQRGFKGSYVEAQKATDAALHHLNKAHFALGAGMNPQEHFDTFDAIHSNIKDRPLHTALGMAKHLVSVSGGKNSKELTNAHNVIRGRLEEGRIAHEDNVQRAMAGREKKNGS